MVQPGADTSMTSFPMTWPGGPLQSNENWRAFEKNFWEKFQKHTLVAFAQTQFKKPEIFGKRTQLQFVLKPPSGRLFLISKGPQGERNALLLWENSLGLGLTLGPYLSCPQTTSQNVLL